MKHLRAGLAVGTALTAMIALSSCASNEAPSGGSSASGGSGSSSAPLSGTLNGVGSSAQTNAQAAWTKGFQTSNSGVTINYDPQGSGAGRTAFEGGGAQFAGSDAALSSDELGGTFGACASGGKGIDIPVYVSPIALVYNVAGVKDLQLDGPTLAGIFSGKITTWNDKAIAGLNKDAKLPSTKITPIYRADKSGTTNNFTDFLHQTAGSTWTAEAADVFPFPKSADVASKTAETSPLDSAHTGNDVVVKLNRTTTDGTEYPITLVSYLVACDHYKDAKVGALVGAYAKYITSQDGQQAAADSAKSAPMTGTLLSKAQASAAAVK